MTAAKKTPRARTEARTAARKAAKVAKRAPVADRAPVGAWTQYAQDVVDGRIPAGQWVVKACQRHLNDLAGVMTAVRPDIYFDEEEADFVVAFIGLLSQSKGEWAGLSLHLEGWEQFIVGCVFGWKRADGTRRFRTVYIEIPRKNGKSTLLGAIGLVLLIADGEPGAEVYSAATKKDQARIVWGEAERMAKASGPLKRRLQIFKNSISDPKTGSKFEPLATDEDSLDGLNVHGGLVDELHAHKSRKVWDVLETATGSRRQPLMVAITTAGDNVLGVCFELHEYVIKILEGSAKDETFFGYIAGIDPGDEVYWDQERIWRKANPNFGVSVKPDNLEQLAKKARETPTAKAAFLRLRLNIWVQSKTPCIPMDAWLGKCSGPVDEDDLEGRRCYGGLDLASTTDIAAFAGVFPPLDQEEPWKVLLRMWAPKEKVAERAKRDRAPYEEWAAAGYLKLTEGATIDFRAIRREIQEFGDRYRIGEIGFDEWNAAELATELGEEDGFTMVKIRQSYRWMNEPMKKMLALVPAGEIRHGDNPLLNWMASNLVAKEDLDGNMRPVKTDPRKKIDGMTALIMGLGRAIANPEDSYTSTEVRVI
jgi:phage terminase large subunit-like protein